MGRKLSDGRRKHGGQRSDSSEETTELATGNLSLVHS